MNTIIKHTALALIAAIAIATISATSAHASNPQQTIKQQPQAKLINPGYPGNGNNGGYNPYLPKFGFNSYNMGGVGDRVTFVQWGGLAQRLGLEPGDTLLSLNGFPLSYHGAWNNALGSAMQNGGWVQLSIRDVRTGWVIQRQINLGYGGGGPIGPVTPKSQITQNGPITSQAIVGNQGSAGQETNQKLVSPQQTNSNKSGNANQQIANVVEN